MTTIKYIDIYILTDHVARIVGLKHWAWLVLILESINNGCKSHWSISMIIQKLWPFIRGKVIITFTTNSTAACFSWWHVLYRHAKMVQYYKYNSRYLFKNTLDIIYVSTSENLTKCVMNFGIFIFVEFFYLIDTLKSCMEVRIYFLSIFHIDQT